MGFIDHYLPEFDNEMASTRKILAAIPDSKLAWKAHVKSNTIGWNANHVAEIPGWVEGTITQLSWDFAPVDGPRYESPSLASTREILELFDRNVAAGKAALQATNDAELAKMWSLVEGGKPFLTMPRSAVLRGFILNHLIHHRAHLCVYLRLNDLPVPGMYGPSGDD